MDFQSKIVNFLNDRKKNVQQVVSQAPQAIQSFGNNLRVQTQPIINNPISQNVGSAIMRSTPALQGLNNQVKFAQTTLKAPQIQSFLKPIQNELVNVATQQIPSAQRFTPLFQPTQNPIAFQNAAKQQIQNFQKNGLVKGAQNFGMDVFNSAKLGANVAGGSKILAGGVVNAAKTILPNAAIGGGINKLSGGSFSEGAGQGVAVSPAIRGVTGVTNPLIEKYTQMLAPRLAPRLTNSAVGNYLTTSTLRGIQNVPEGAVIDATLGRRPLSPESMALDLATGFLPGSPNARGGLNVNANAKQVQMPPQDRDIITKTLERMVNNKDNADYQIRFRERDEAQIRQMAEQYLNKTVAWKGKFDDVAQELFNRAKVDAGDMQFGLPGMGLVAKKNVSVKPQAQIQKEVGGFKKGEEVGFAGILSPKGEARKGKFVRKVNENLVEIDYGDHKELNHINNIYKLGRKDLNFLEANPLNQSLQGAKPQTQIQKEVGGELNQLIKEAKKYKSAAEFESAIRDNKNGVGNLWSKYRKNYDDPNLMGMWDIYNQHVKSPLKSHTQLGSATNTRADQIAGKFRTNQTIQPQQSYIPETPQPRLANVKGVATSLISDTEAQRVLKNQEIKRTAQEMPQSDSQSTKQSGGIIPSNDDIIANARKEIGRVDKPNNAGLKETIRTAADKFYTDWIDRYHPIMKMVGGVEKQGKKLGFDIIPKNNPKYTIRRFLGMGGIAEERYDRELKPILDELDKLKIDKTDMDVYLKARRDVGFGDIGRDIFGSDANLGAARVRAIEQKYGEAIKPIADKLYAYQSKGFDDLVDAGFVAKDKSNLIKSQNPDYVPFIRKMDDQLDEFLGIPTKVAQQKANPLKKIEGSERAIYSPIESVVVNTFKQRAAIEKNNVAKSIVGLQKIMPELGFERASKEGAGVITVWENGQKNLYQVGGEIAEAVKGMNEEQINGWMKTMTIPASIMRQGATGRNPEFMIPNVVRDQLDAAMNSKYGYIPFVDWAKGLSHVLKQDEVYSKWKSSGASMSFSKLSGRKNIQEMYDEKLVKKKAIEKLGSFLGKGLDKLGQLSEEPTRVGLFNKAYKKTGNELIANLEARESSMDFSRMGSKMKVANSVIPFLNVGIQGFDKMIRTARENPAKFTALMGLYGATPAIATAVYNNTFHPEEYAKIPSYVREDNFIIVTGKDSEGNAEYISIPKGHTIQYIANPIDDFISYAANTNKQSLPAMLTQFLSSGTPVTGDGSTVKEVALKTIGQNLPQAIKPVTESLLNKSFFKYDTNSDEAKEIVPYYLKDKPAAEQAYDHTPAMYKGIARGLAQANINVSPLNIQNVMEGYLAGGSKIPANVIDMMIAAGEGKDVDKNKIPLLRRFLQKTYPIPERDKEITPEKVGLFNKASAAETTTPQTSEAIIAKNKQDDKDARAKIEKGSSAFLSNNKIYLDRDKNGSAETIDLTPPTKGTGIASFKNDNWKYSKAKSIWNDNSVPSDVKNLAFKQLGVKQEDVRYDALASYTVDEKAQYISAKSGTKEKLIENIKTGRKVSVSGAINASDGVIDKLVDEGRLTKAEAKELKKIDYNKDGTLKQAKSSGGSKKGSLKIDFRQFIRKAPKSKTYTAPKLAAPVKLKSVKGRKLKDLSYKGKPLAFKKKTSTTYK